jgi:peroxiredoxin family protein
MCFLHFSNRGLFHSRALLNVDCSGVNQVECLFDLQAVRYCISAAFFAVLWDLHHLEEVMENGANGTEQLQLLKTRLHMFMDTMKELLMSGHNQTYVEEVSEQKHVATHCWYVCLLGLLTSVMGSS